MAKQAARIKDADGAAAPPRSRRKLLMIAAPVAAVLLAGGGLVASGLVQLGHHKRVVADVAPRPKPVFVELPEMIVNLDAGPGREAFAKVQCRIEVDGDQRAQVVTASMPIISDMLQTYLRAMHPDEISGGTGVLRLREALLARAAVAVPDARIDDVLFEELVVQ